VTRLLNFFSRRRDRLERDLVRELRYHMDRRVEDLIKDGLDVAEARRRASIELGGVPQVQEAVRETWTWRWLDAFLRDVRYAMRSLARNWGFTLGVGAVLALAIGANVAIFSVVSTVLLQPLPYPDAGRIVSIETFFTNTGQSSPMVSSPDFLDWQAQNDVFEKIALLSSRDQTGTVVGGGALFSNPRFVSADFFAVFGQPAFAGRLLAERDFQTGGVAVVAYPWALTHFGSAEAAIGESLLLYGGPVEVVGVAAPGFRYPEDTDLWLPLNDTPPPGASAAAVAAQRSNYAYQAVGKLGPGVEFTRAEATMRALGDSLARQHPENRLKNVMLTPLREWLTGGVRTTLWILMSAVGVVWLIACANVANLLLGRAAARTREIALRTALGAGRGRVVRQLLTESCVLAGAAGLAGLALAFVLIQGIVAFSPVDLPRIDDVQLDVTVLGFALGLSLVSTAIFGLVPALHASRLDLSDALKQGGPKATMSRASSRLRSALVVAEVALSVILLAAAGLLVRSFEALQHVDLGFTKGRVLAAYTEYAVEDSADIPNRIQFFADVLDRLRAVPGVEAAAGAAYLGMGWEPRALRDVFVDGRPAGQPGERPQAEIYDVTEDYFRTLGIPMLAGRDFAVTDAQERPGVAIINATLARIAFPGASPLGQRIRVTSDTEAPALEVVGVVGDTRWQDPSQPAPPVMFRSARQGTGNSPSILVRSSVDVASLVPTLRSILNEADPTVPVEFETMEAMFDSTLRYPRFRTQVIGLFAGLATILAAVGIFSVLAYLVGQRTRELALRRALGAGTADVVHLVVDQGLRLVATGLALGLAGALVASRLLTGLLYEIGPSDVVTYLGTIAVLGTAALLATLVPALRAATIAPLVILQQD
jgi:putative ABC transport system permease protein